ncbi:MAG: tetratricopeptide repeat protein [Planctomycetota bacterium]
MSRHRHEIALAALYLVAAIGIQAPALTGAFLWDDVDWIADNENLRSLSGLLRIWFEPGASIQYYPLTFTSWWIDRALFGLSPVAMHVENAAGHAANALLFALLLRRIGMRGHALAGLLFLAHPVHVESVAWIVERKNVLSTLLYLWALHAFVSHLDGLPGRKGRALLWFGAALLAKTATLMLPAALWVLCVLRGRKSRAILGDLRPFLLLSAAAGAVTILMERKAGAVGHDWALSLCERFCLAGQIEWFALGKLLLPVSLSFVYPKWEIGADSPFGWMPTLSFALLLLLLLRARPKPIRDAGLCLFAHAAHMLPTSGLVDFYYLRYAYTADHFQYLPSLAPLAWIAAVLWSRTPRPARFPLAALMAGALGSLAFAHARVFTDEETLWRETIRSRPNAWLAQTNLGNLLDRRDGPGAGLQHHLAALEIEPDAFESLNAVGNDLARHGEFDRAREVLERALAVRPEDPLTCNNLGALEGAAGNWAEARIWFERGIEKDPDNADLMRNLSLLLSECPDPAQRDAGLSLALARSLAARPGASLLDRYALFRALLLSGQRDEAVAVGREVARRAGDAGDREIADRVRRQLERL